ncbi:general odorant-binding protein 84a isoform X1 [Drosophila santomea]|uniref:general odorant-binding protein 84a isoform X1 n=1 Tax=Drosophila santomea TaxID=129105 RepID=UPI001954BB71|nr:general odorant-binding protein 84a isoform X1 [Drosophila santomea]
MFRSLYLIGVLSLIWVAAQDIVPDDPEVQMQKHAMFYTARVACADENMIPYANVLQFNSTGELPDDKDKATSMCYFHCFFEKSGLMTDYKLNTDLVRKYVWPATGDSVEACEAEGKDETNACMRGYAIVKCVFTRALTDARNKPTI